MDSDTQLPKRAPGAHLLLLEQRGFPTLPGDAQVLLYLVRVLRTVLGDIEHDLLQDGDLDPARKRFLADTLTESAKVIRGRNPDIIDSMPESPR